MSSAKIFLRYALPVFVSAAVILGFLPRCASFNRAIDRSGLEDKVQLALNSPDAGRLTGPLPFIDSASLDILTRPAALKNVKIEKLVKHRYESDDVDLIQEKLTFDTPITLKHPEANRATLYIYRHGVLGERPVVLWVPGLYVSDIAFTPISWFFEEIFDRGMDIVFYVLPYHLGRSPKGMESGDAMLSTDLTDHFRSLAQGLAELRTISTWLRGQGVKTLGAFGGSTGANLLLRQLTYEPAYDFLTVFIPLVSWEDVIYDNPITEPLRNRIAEMSEPDQKAVRAAWNTLASGQFESKLAPERISVLRARWDQVARGETIAAWQKSWNVKRLFELNRGHTLALFDSGLYDAYGAFLDEDLESLRH